MTNNGLGLTIDIPDLEETEKMLQGIGADFQTRKYLHRIGYVLLRWVNQNFREEGKEVKWKPLSLNTVAARRKRSRKILQDTGRLRMSFVSKVSEAGQWVAVGTADQRAPWHHYGTKPYTIVPRRRRFLRFKVHPGEWAFAKKVKHPGLKARPLLPSESLARKMVIEELEKYIEEVLKKAELMS